ncbi:MAG: hypothetical protein JWQ70_1136 [Aeromicrobium sp.]|nr:hypothetical protein [Aeromicrobium sp.]
MMTEIPRVTGVEHIGRAVVPMYELERLGRLALGSDSEDPRLISVTYRPSSYPTSTIPTERLTHCELEFGDGQVARIFVKEIRDVTHWPMLHAIPEHLLESFVSGFPWRLEIELYANGFGCPMPAGMRLPDVYSIQELEEGRAALWMEDVQALSYDAWTTVRFARAAHLLGQLAAGRIPPGVLPLGLETGTPFGPNLGVRMMFNGRVESIFRPAIEGDELWQHPTVVAALERTGDRAIIADLRALVSRGQALIDESDSLPMTYAHGDASPQNLLIPADDPDTFVVIDPGLNSQLPVGHDLGQLLVGLCHAGEMDPSELEGIHRVILPAYIEGLTAAGMAVDPADVERGYLSGLLLRSGFSAIPLEQLNAPTSDQAIALWSDRIRMTRAILDFFVDSDAFQTV